MQVTKEASGLWVDFCLFWLCLPPPVRVMWPLLLNANKLSCMSFLTTTMQLLCLCLGVLQASAQWKPYYSITSDFQTIPSSMEYFYQFCSSVNSKMDLLKMQQFLLWSWRRERMQLQTYPFSRVTLFPPSTVTPSWHSRTHNFAHMNILKEGQILLWDCLRRLSTLP